MPPVGFQPTISVGERSQTYDLDLTATGTGVFPSRPYMFRQLNTDMQPLLWGVLPLNAS